MLMPSAATISRLSLPARISAPTRVRVIRKYNSSPATMATPVMTSR